MLKRVSTLMMLSILAIFLIGSLIGFKLGRLSNIPFVSTCGEWSIGIYTGDSLSIFNAPENIKNPVLTRHDVTDVNAVFVSDPFMVKDKNRWFMFFEIMNAVTQQGDIGLATSEDGLKWHYEKVVLDEPFHLSYPQVFKWDSVYYMIPESINAFSVRLYRAVVFPFKWEVVSTLVYGHLADPSILHHDNKWWLFGCTSNYSTILYEANNLAGPYIEHPQSPIIQRSRVHGRSGGRIAHLNNRIIRYVQDCYPTYGRQLRAFEITELSSNSYAEKEIPGSPILQPSGSGWNADGMHTLDPIQVDLNRWVACVDGFNDHWLLGGWDY
jgi:hypothetical protein